MLSRGRITLKSLLILMSITFGSALASGFFPIYEDPAQPKVNGAALGSYGLGDMYVVGDAGSYYFTNQSGYSWNSLSTGVTENLTSIASAIEWQNNNNRVHITVGENGTVLRYDHSLLEWTSSDTLGVENYNVVYFDNNSSRFWIGGDSGQLYYSTDFGRTWIRQTLDATLNARAMTSTYNGLLLYTEKSDTTFILRENIEIGGFYSVLGDTLPDIKLISATVPIGGETNDVVYLLGLETGSTITHLLELDPFGYGGPPTNLFTGDLGLVSDLAVYGYEELKFWITTLGGTIWEAKSYEMNWIKVYQDPDGKELGPIIASGNDADPSRVFGAGGLVLKYGFEVNKLWPDFNRNLSSEFNQTEIGFSLIPDLHSIESGIRILSDQRGTIPFGAEYSSDDSNLVFLNLQNEFGLSQIPGDKFNISLSDSLRRLGDTGSSDFHGFNYDITLVSPHSTSFRFDNLYRAQPLHQTTTNWVTGLINQDETLDLLTFANDTLYCFVGADSGQYDNLVKIPLPGTINLDINKSEQLILADINGDGLQDLIMYDFSRVFLVMNNSTASDVVFNVSPEQWTDEVITKVVAYNANNNDQVDLMILGYSFITRFDISESSFGSNFTTHEFGTVYHRNAGIADINGDGQQDMILIDNDGQLLLREGYGNGYFDQYNQVISGSGRGYTGFKTADLDDDQKLEIMASSNLYIDLYSFNEESEVNWVFDLAVQNFVNTGQVSLLDFYVQDFGGSRDGDIMMRLDIIALTPDSIILYENETIHPKNFQLHQLSKESIPIDLSFDFLLAGDFDKNAALDIAAYDIATGQFSIWNKFTWQPVIEDFSIRNRQVELNWTPLPIEAGALDYYKIARDSSSHFGPQSYVRQSGTNHFIDYEMGEYESFWYAVQAVYNNGIESEWSKPVFVQTYYELNGAQAGVIDDTTRPYLVKSSISVEPDSSLFINEGVRIGFDPGTRFDVYGSLIVTGNEVTDNMVDLHDAHWDEGGWEGIYLHPGADTVSFTWFSVGGAKNGINVNARPLKMRFGGIFKNEVGLLGNDDSLTVHNIIFDSNMVALKMTGTTSAEIMNVNILHSQLNSIVAEGESKIFVRNAIIWNNLGPVTKDSDAATVRIKYSTVDSMEQNISRTEIRELAPVFVLSDTGQYYQVDYLSPTIDAGDPSDDFNYEPAPNGGRINQGLYGGSYMATPSLQPRISIEPDTVTMTVRLGHSDTSGFFIKNPGYTDLQISSIVRTDTSNIFYLLGNLIPIITPGDSVLMEVVFRPDSVQNYSNELLVTCNDPHLTGSAKKVILTGTGIYIAPPTISIEPDTVKMMARIGYSDTSGFMIKNPGGEILHVSAIEQADTSSVFKLLGNLTPEISPADSALVQVVFTPGATQDYNDTLQIICNDPNLIDGIKKVVLSGTGSDIVPVVQLDPMVTPVLKEAAARFWFSVMDSGSAFYEPSVSGTYKVQYQLVNTTSPDTIQPREIGHDHLDYYPLDDGVYEFKIWTTLSPAGIDFSQYEKKQTFKVDVKTRPALKYRWHMVSFPRAFSIDWNWFELGDTSASLLKWNNSLEEYSQVNKKHIQPGQAFWAFPYKAFELDLTKADLANSSGVPHLLPDSLERGWNQIGVPVGYNLFWHQMHIITNDGQELDYLSAMSEGVIDSAVYWFMQNSDFQGYDWTVVDTTTKAEPWKGYWVHTNQVCMLSFPDDPAFYNRAGSAIVTPAQTIQVVQKDAGWQINLSLSNKYYTDKKNVIGINSSGSIQITEPPHIGDFCALYIPSEKGKLAQKIYPAFKNNQDIKIWNLQVVSRNDKLSHTLSWNKNTAGATGVYLYLVDEQRETVINLSDQETYVFTPSGSNRSFKIYAAQDASFRPEIIPLTFKMDQNYPNPFNPKTTIRFGIPANADGLEASLTVFDVLGKKVAEIYKGNLKMGYHEFTWDGSTINGIFAASGVYFYRLKAGKTQLIKKMVLVR